MHISRVELENIKSHASSKFDFARGTTAIRGENGAGKTTIIEGIAWVLFDLLEYKKEDFVRRGAKRGSVTVTFESSLDGREYVVYRDSGTAYNVTDPRLGARIADKREEVFRFLWQHQGLEPGTDLKSLFRQAIGVPQGTFTAIFLEGATDRKVAFDRLLKVEEYRQAAEKLRETSRYLDNSIGHIRETIARAEGELSRAGVVEEELATLSEQSALLQSDIDQASTTLTRSRKLVAGMDEREKLFITLRTKLERTRAEKEKAELVLKQAMHAVEQAREAAEKRALARPGHELYVATLEKLKGLDQRRGERERLRTELAEIDAGLVNANAEKSRLTREIEAAKQAAAEIESLRPKAAEQSAIEKQVTEFRDRIASARSAQERVRSIEAELDRLRENYKLNKAGTLEAQAMTDAAAGLPALESRDAELTTSIARLRASLERDEKFQSEIRDGLCPILSARCFNMADGVTLESFVSSQFSEIRESIRALETERSRLAADIQSARQGARYIEALEERKRREAELREEGAILNAKKALFEKELAELNETESQLAAAEARLKSLEDPAGRIRLLEKETTKEVGLRDSLTELQAKVSELESKKEATQSGLAEFREFDEQWSALTAERDSTAEAHRTFVANESLVASLATLENELVAAKAALSVIAAGLTAAEEEFSGLSYDPEAHAIERKSLVDAEKSFAKKQATLDATRKREEQLNEEMRRFADLRKSLSDEFREKDRLEQVGEATAFIRDTLKEAAPRVARNYVHHVSIEANQMFREITGKGECTLKWCEDYSITLEEEGYERPFISLSGGEQMSAALAVRLAILKQLSDIRIAFFDEPTTNMDETRRENFAQQISRITNFDQLFVISHDDTFDHYVDHVIALS